MSERERTPERVERPEDEIPTAVESWRRHMRIRELIEQARRARRLRGPTVAKLRAQR